jgi:hypothetical protein
MHWYDSIVLLLRFIIGDTSDVPKYTDPKLAQLFLVAAQLVQSEVNFWGVQTPLTMDQTGHLAPPYTVDIVNVNITPDPNGDPYFVNLTMLKAAAILARALLPLAISGSYNIMDGSAKLDTTKTVEAVKNTVDKFEKAYEDAKWNFRTTRNYPGEAILGPYRVLVSQWGLIYPRTWRGGF